MAFGRKRNMESETQPPTDIDSDTEGTHISETQDQTPINVDDEVQKNEKTAPTSSVEKDPSKPLLEEVTFTSTGNSKNSGGSKPWTCNHCKGNYTSSYTSSYTRIHVHFFGPPPGRKKAEIKRCPVLVKGNTYYDILYNRVKEAEKKGVAAKSLKNSVLSQNSASKRGIEDAFKMLEREELKGGRR
ncbi:hypothetical protein L1887_14270 [Cichorium endivia]|nr:hypothetical protein L1887_14270 [Cichorium endivia]